MDRMIHIPGKKLRANEQGVIKLSAEAIEDLVDLANESGMSIKRIASEIITQAVRKNLIVFDRGEQL